MENLGSSTVVRPICWQWCGLGRTYRGHGICWAPLWGLHLHCLGHIKVVWMGGETDPMARCSPCTDGSTGSVTMWTVAVEPKITQDGQQMRWWEKQNLDGCEVCTRQKQSGVYFSQLPFRGLAEIRWERVKLSPASGQDARLYWSHLTWSL